jgi:hypothetical protein
MIFPGVTLRLMALMLIFSLAAPSFAQTVPAMAAPMGAAKLHQKLVARGIGKGAKVIEVDGTAVNGILVTIDADSFQIAPSNALKPTLILNSQVTKFNNSGMSTGAKVGIGIGIGAGVIIAYILITVAASN